MTNEAFKKGTAALILAFPNRIFDNDFMWDYLNDLDDEEFLTAIQKVISSSKELYPGSNIIAIVRENAKVGKRLSAGEAWGLVLREVSLTGSYGVPKFVDPLVARAVEAVGWRHICLSENIMVERAHFLKIYDTLDIREKQEATYLPSLRIKELTQQIINTNKSLTQP
jgi:hypothetical protein